MRFITAIWASILTLAVISSYADVPVYHFSPQTQQMITENISGLSNLINLTSTGNYAWACDSQGNASFYNGQQWQSAQKIPNISKFISIYPAYPLTGKQPTAWVLGKQGNQYIISYFNGTTWSNVQTVPKSAGQISLAASAGYVWYVLNDQAGNNATVHVASGANPTNWTTSNIALHGVTSGAGDVIKALNDDAAFAYVFGFNENWEIHVARIDGNGSITILSNPAGKIDDYFIYQNNVILSHSRHSQSLSTDNGQTFKTSAAPGIAINAQYNFNTAGMECTNLQNTGNSLSCLSTSNMVWQNFTVPSTATYNIPFTTPVGAYVFGLDQKSKTVTSMYSYDYAGNSVSDTKPMNYKSVYFSPRFFSYNQVLMAGEDNNGNQAAYFYDSQQWQTLVLPALKTPHVVYDINIFGNAGSGTMQFYAADGNHIWFYPHTLA